MPGPGPGAWVPPQPPDANTFRIFISTDNHLGFAEKHDYPPRQDDSFLAVEEVLENATASKADILLLGGDLFHDNKPSRQCMVRSMKLFRQYVFGSRPVQVEPTSVDFVNDETGKGGYVNWEDENMNIGLPVFIIHGNHDDPAGKGNFSALDELSTAGLLNYFGKQTDTQHLLVKPVILTKGTCKLAIYGIGNIKDERLHENFKKERVKFEVPSPKEDYFHILVIHQNRAQKGVKNYIPTELLPDFLNFIIWGHEHECRIRPEEATLKDGKTAHLTQPGSTVQTSLIAVEAERKHMAYMDIQCVPAQGDSARFRYKFKPVEHRCTRPFIYDEIVLSNEMKSDGQPAVKNTEESVMKFLEKKIKELVKQAKDDYGDRSPALEKPMIRLKVEHTGYPTIAPRRFGQLFADSDPDTWAVANPFELLTFWRKAREVVRRPKPQDADMDDDLGVDRDILEAPEIQDLVVQELDRSSANLEVLAKDHLFHAVNQFVEKEEPQAIRNMVSDQLKEIQDTFGKHVQNGQLASVTDKDLMEQVKALLATRQKEHSSPSKVPSSSRKDSQPGSSANALPSRSSAAGRGGGSSARNDSIALDDSDDEPAVPAAGTGRGRGGSGAAARGGGRGGVAAGRGAAAKGKTRQMPLSFGSQSSAGLGGASSKAAPKAARGATKRKAKATSSEDDDDDDEYQQDGSEYDSDDAGTTSRARARPTATRGGGRGAAGKKASAQANASGAGVRSRARGNAAADDDTRSSKRRRGESDSDEDEDVQPSSSMAASSSAWGA